MIIDNYIFIRVSCSVWALFLQQEDSNVLRYENLRQAPVPHLLPWINYAKVCGKKSVQVLDVICTPNLVRMLCLK